MVLTKEMIHDPGKLYIHVPTPGDHYSSATGSAVMTIIYELSRKHEDHGGRTQIIVGRSTRHDYSAGDCVEADFSRPENKYEKLTDVILGKIGLGRIFGTAIYRPATEVIAPEFNGPIFLHNSPVAVELFRKSHKRSLVCLYAHNSLFRTYIKKEVEKVVASADFIICVSAFIADGLRARLGKDTEKIKVIHSGVDLERFKPASPRGSGEVPVILFVGRVAPEKGVDLLLRAARKIYGKNRRFKIRIVGSRGFSALDPLSGYEKRLRRIAWPIREIVEFQPFVGRDKILDEYRAASVFCVPSNWGEPLSLAVLEGLACGLPAVVSCRGGLPEAAGDAALYFEPPDIGRLADHLAYLVDDKLARESLGLKARSRAEMFSWDRQYLALRDAISGE